MPPADIAYPGLLPASASRDFYGLAIVLYEILCGPDSHPYLTHQQRQWCKDVDHDPEIRLRMSAWITDAPRVIWTKEVRRNVSPALIGLIEAMLRRDSGRAGMAEVGA